MLSRSEGGRGDVEGDVPRRRCAGTARTLPFGFKIWKWLGMVRDGAAVRGSDRGRSDAYPCTVAAKRDMDRGTLSQRCGCVKSPRWFRLMARIVRVRLVEQLIMSGMRECPSDQDG